MILLISQYFLFGNYGMHEEVKKYIYAPKDSLYYKILANYNYIYILLYSYCNIFICNLKYFFACKV